MKKISVVLPTIGRLEYLDKSIASILEQTIPFDEFIVFDNSKSQDLRESSIHKDNTSIRWVLSGEFMEAIASWNTAVAACANDYITIFGDDDIAHPHFHEQAQVVLERSEFGLLPLLTMDSDGVPGKIDTALYHDIDSEEFRYKRLRGKISYAIPGFVFKKDRFLSVGGFQDTHLPGYTSCDDMLWFELSALAGRVAVSDRVCWYYRKHRSSQGSPSTCKEYSKVFSDFVTLMHERLVSIGVDRNRVFPHDFGAQDYIDRMQKWWFTTSFTLNLLKHPFRPATYICEIGYYLSGDSSLLGKASGLLRALKNVITGGPRFLLKRVKGLLV